MRPSLLTVSRSALRSCLNVKSVSRVPQLNAFRAATTSAPSSSSSTTPAKKPATSSSTYTSSGSSYSSANKTEPKAEAEGRITTFNDHVSHEILANHTGFSTAPFPKEVAAILQAPVDVNDIEIKPDGIIFLPEIKYRRILNKAFGPGGWGLTPRGETTITGKLVSREYALLCQGRLVSIARGEQQYYGDQNIPTATEGCKSNALMRCCKDLGIASELWDPRFIRKWKKDKARQVWVTEKRFGGKSKPIWLRKDDPIPDGFTESKGNF